MDIRKSARNLLALCLGLIVLSSMGETAVAQDDEQSPYDGLWDQVSQLLEAREYSSALAVITDAQDEPEMKKYKAQLEVDEADLKELQRLAKIVRDQASKLKAGDPIKVGSTEYKVVKFISDAQGDRLQLESPNSSSKTEKTLAQLDPKAWLALAEPKLSTTAEDRHMVGMFQASVERGDRKAARQALNLAAEAKIPVSQWTARMDAEVQAAQDEKSAKKAALDDKILGTWRFVIGEGKGQRRFNITFRPRGKTDARTSTWRKAGGDHYKLTFPGGGTAHLEMGPRGEGMKGKMANGAPVHAQREAKSKK